MEQSPKARNSPPFMEPEVYYRVHNSPLHLPILSQMNPFHTPNLFL